MENKTKTEKIAPIIWLAFLSSVFTYIFILFSIHGGLSQIGDLDYDRMFRFQDPIILSLYVFSALSLGAYYIIPNFIVSLNPGKKAFTGFIVRLALLEAICLYGFVLGIIYEDPQTAIPFFVLSFVGIFTMNPFTKLKDAKPSHPSTMT